MKRIKFDKKIIYLIVFIILFLLNLYYALQLSPMSRTLSILGCIFSAKVIIDLSKNN